jgi:hypothetical protein
VTKPHKKREDILEAAELILESFDWEENGGDAFWGRVYDSLTDIANGESCLDRIIN